MKIVQITSRYGSGSIGKICSAVSNLLTDKGVENYILYSWGSSNAKNAIRCSNNGRPTVDTLKAKISGYYGFCNNHNTTLMIRALEKINPDIVQIHNIHAHNCNVRILFDYLRAKRIRVFYTFHDCWAFTGYCPYFDSVNCNKWQEECVSCPQYHKYSFLFDRSQELYRKKREALQGIDMTIITPSKWLANLVAQSFLKDYPVKVINNGIDLSVFTPTQSNFRKKHQCENKTLLLGIASKWEKRKGLDTFIKLSHDLDSSFKIVLVGTNDAIDKQLPDNIISIHRTEGQKQLAEIYSSADVLINPTMEENFPTVNVEAIACGTPVITYDTGGSAEMLDASSGIVIERGNYDALLSVIKGFPTIHNFSIETCVRKSLNYAQEQKFAEYLELYGI